MKENKQKTNEMHKGNFRKFGMNMNLGVTLTALFIILTCTILAIFNYQTLPTAINDLSTTVLNIFSTPMYLLVFGSFILVIVVSATPLGNIVIGGVKEKPRFKRFSWYAMLFGAGMGIGFMFWGVAEPLIHSQGTPIFMSDNNISQAIATTVFHWGLQPWALYALIAAALAFYSYNLKLPLAPRSLFYPILKDKIFSRIGDIIDGIAVVLTLFSLATSLGFGAMQVNAGFNYLFGTDVNSTIQIIIIIVVTLAATLSVVSGLDKGVRILSEMNLNLAALLATVILLLGPTVLIITGTLDGLLLYLKDFLGATFTLMRNSSNPEVSSWSGAWTLFYWAWWIGWTIFVGIFIAKISKGRTIREFLLSVTIIPSIIAVVWFGIFGISGISADNLMSGQLTDIVAKDEALSLYALINSYDIINVLKYGLYTVSIILVISFFVTSSDSGSLVVDNLTSGGAKDNPVQAKIFWASLEGVLGIGLILAGGETVLATLQQLLIIMAGPFSIVLIVVFTLITIEWIKYYRYHRFDKARHDLESNLIPRNKKQIQPLNS